MSSFVEKILKSNKHQQKQKPGGKSRKIDNPKL